MADVADAAADEERHASWLELFFDLVFVLVVSQVASGLIHDFTGAGLLRFVLVFVPVWWAWTGFTFFHSRFPADTTFVRLALFGAMLLAAAWSTTVSGAVAGRPGPGFAICYGCIRLCLVVLYLSAGRDPSAKPLARYYATGFGVGALLWLVSPLVPSPWRYAVWAAAVLIEVFTPAFAGDRLRDAPSVHPTHLPERFGLFVIIVLGESVVAVGGGFESGSGAAAAVVGAGCFALAATIWWTYFDFAALAPQRHLLESANRGAFARDVYSYGHFPVIVGIAVTTVGAELAVEHAHETELASGVRFALAGGVALYLTAIAAMTIAVAHGRARQAEPVLIAAAVAVLAAGAGARLRPPWFVAVVASAVVVSLAVARRTDVADEVHARSDDPHPPRT